MSYSTPVAPNTNDGGSDTEDWNTVTYINPTANGGILSIADRYPITKITQPQAIEACQSL
jgi:hypothetical protein